MIFQVSYGMDQSINKQKLEHIPADQLPQYVGKKVVYRKGSDNYENVVLGKRVLETSFYEARSEIRSQYGIVCREDKLYKLLS
jgi:hypothetical protein